MANDWKTNGQLRACATQALADTQLLDWDSAVLAIEKQIARFAEHTQAGVLRTTDDHSDHKFSRVLWYGGVGHVPEHEAIEKLRHAKRLLREQIKRGFVCAASEFCEHATIEDCIVAAVVAHG